ncbi:MAG: hypothetical protein HZB53_20075 [Chloroflexi bacterium]|nr:hypothetical protein [Chloroflexota bacterium]
MAKRMTYEDFTAWLRQMTPAQRQATVRLAETLIREYRATPIAERRDLLARFRERLKVL